MMIARRQFCDSQWCCLLCFCFSLVKGEAPSAPCGEGWAHYSPTRSCVKISNTPGPWNKSRALCKQFKGDLIKIVDSKMNDFVSGIFSSEDYLSFWIGLVRHDGSSHHGFAWLDETTKASYSNWASGEPHENGTACGKMYGVGASKGTWSDADCSEKNKVICETDQACGEHMNGKHCLGKCSAHCKGANKACKSEDGTCTSGCDEGYQGFKCDTECDSGRYGLNCSRNCSVYCGGPAKACHNVDGVCLRGCVSGYEGKKCDTKAVVQDEGAFVTFQLIITVAGAFILSILMMIGFAVLTMRRNASQSKAEEDSMELRASGASLGRSSRGRGYSADDSGSDSSDEQDTPGTRTVRGKVLRMSVKSGTGTYASGRSSTITRASGRSSTATRSSMRSGASTDYTASDRSSRSMRSSRGTFSSGGTADDEHETDESSEDEQ